MASGSFPVLVSGDDYTFDRGSGATYFSATDTTDAARNVSTILKYWLGLRFDNVTIPQGATITSAHIRWYCRYLVNNSSSYSLTIHVIEQDDPSAPNSLATAEALPRSSSTVVQGIPDDDWTWHWEESDDLTSLVQAIVNRSGWASGNAIQFQFTGGSDTYEYFVLTMYDGSYPAELHVEWESEEILDIEEPESGTEVEFSSFDALIDCFSESQTEVESPRRFWSLRSTHGQSGGLIGVQVTKDVPTGALDLRDQYDELVLESLMGPQLEDTLDTIIFVGTTGTVGTLALEDMEEEIAALAGGELQIGDDLDAFSLTGTATAFGTLSLFDPDDALNLEGLPGTIGSMALKDDADTFLIAAQSEVLATMALKDRLDTLSITAAPGTSGTIFLDDDLDHLSFEGDVDVVGSIGLFDGPDRLSLIPYLTLFATDSIQYVRERI